MRPVVVGIQVWKLSNANLLPAAYCLWSVLFSLFPACWPRLPICFLATIQQSERSAAAAVEHQARLPVYLSGTIQKLEWAAVPAFRFE